MHMFLSSGERLIDRKGGLLSEPWRVAPYAPLGRTHRPPEPACRSEWTEGSDAV
jgi:hypothetical protein